MDGAIGAFTPVCDALWRNSGHRRRRMSRAVPDPASPHAAHDEARKRQALPRGRGSQLGKTAGPGCWSIWNFALQLGRGKHAAERIWRDRLVSFLLVSFNEAAANIPRNARAKEFAQDVARAMLQ